ncbi:MAG TPA: hypothetical protein VJP77_05730 [Planctomycetota bacterium]|nr:hypothetical protein [Planctomycetota bacterium]
MDPIKTSAELDEERNRLLRERGKLYAQLEKLDANIRDLGLAWRRARRSENRSRT